MLLNIDLHTHTRRYSRCSILSPDTLCKVAIERGLNALAITEHHYQWSEDEVASLQARYPSLKLYAGVEISCSDGHDYVVLGLGSGPHRPPRMPFEQFQSLINARPGAFVFIAHCFRYTASDRGLAELLIDGIEVGSYNILAYRQPEAGPIQLVRAEMYQRWQKQMGWKPLCNSDGHSKGMIGTFYSQIEAPDGMPPDEMALNKLLRKSEIRCVQDDKLIREAMCV
jgi:predicted metal-dependent phosphoesterase TrpH